MGCRCMGSSSEQYIEMRQDRTSTRQSITKETTLLNEQKYMEKYADYPEKIVSLINKIRNNPREYADIIEDSIQNIIKEDNNDPTKPKIIYKEIVKVALIKGEEAFREAAHELRNMNPLPPLEFKKEICIPLPDNEEQFKDSNYLKEKVKEILSKNIRINVFYKELVKIPEISVLLMIVDDNGKNAGKKRRALLNKNFKYIGVSFRFIGKHFISYFAFSK